MALAVRSQTIHRTVFHVKGAHVFLGVLMSSSELHECLRPPSADAAPSIIGGMLHLLREAELHSKRKEITVGQLGFGCNLQDSGQSGWRLSLPNPRVTSVQAHCGKQQQHRKEKSKALLSFDIRSRA